MLRATADTHTVSAGPTAPPDAFASRATSPSRTATRCSAALADGESTINGYSPGADCAATLACLRALGRRRPRRRPRRTRHRPGAASRGLRPARAPLDAVNSGTTIRLMSGILAAHPFTTTIGGDASLVAAPDAPDHRAADADGRAHRGGQRPGAADDCRRRPARHRLRAGRAERPGQERRAPRRPARRRPDARASSRPRRATTPSAPSPSSASTSSPPDRRSRSKGASGWRRVA